MSDDYMEKSVESMRETLAYARAGGPFEKQLIRAYLTDVQPRLALLYLAGGCTLIPAKRFYQDSKYCCDIFEQLIASLDKIETIGGDNYDVVNYSDKHPEVTTTIISSDRTSIRVNE